MPKFIGYQGVAQPAAPTQTYLGSDIDKIKKLTLAQYQLRASTLQPVEKLLLKYTSHNVQLSKTGNTFNKKNSIKNVTN